MNDATEELLQELENAASFMRGMWLDPRVPAHAKSALMAKAEELEALVAKHLENPQ